MPSDYAPDPPDLLPCCSLPRSLVLRAMREQQLRELRYELGLYESDTDDVVSSLSAAAVDTSVRLLRERIAGLEAGTISPDDGVR